MVDSSAEHPSISSLLVLSFVSVGALMILGGAIALWELNFIHRRAQYLYQADEPARAALHVHRDFLRFQRELQSLAIKQDAARFAEEGNRLRLAFETDVERATQAARALPAGTQRDSEISSLETLRTLPSVPTCLRHLTPGLIRVQGGELRPLGSSQQEGSRTVEYGRAGA